MTVRELIHQLRQLVLEHPETEDALVLVHPHGTHPRQTLEGIQSPLFPDAIVLEARR